MPDDTRTGEPDSSDQWPDHWTVERLLRDPDNARDADEQDLATLFAALRAPAEPHELARERDQVAAFDAARALTSEPTMPRRRSMLAQFLATKTAAAAVAAAAVAAGAAGAATGTLPQGLQQVAHDTLGAPAPDRDTPAAEHATGKDNAKDASATGSSNAVGPDATGAAKDGLCTAFESGGLATASVAYRELAEAAGGAEQIPAYCDADATPTDEPSTRSTGKPSVTPTGKPSDKGTEAADPADKGSRPTDKPSATPSIPANG